jgi:hypothetical protein
MLPNILADSQLRLCDHCCASIERAAIAHNVSPHHAAVFGAKKDFPRLNFAYQHAPKTVERPQLFSINKGSVVVPPVMRRWQLFLDGSLQL